MCHSDFNIQQNNRPNNININNNKNFNDKRLIICLNYLGLKKYVINFIKSGINFDDFLSLSNKDLSTIKIPGNIQEIIQKFIISYLNYGSLYTSEEIIQFFKNKNQNKLNKNNNSKKIINHLIIIIIKEI